MLLVFGDDHSGDGFLPRRDPVRSRDDRIPLLWEFLQRAGFDSHYAGGPNSISFLLFTVALALAGLALALYFILSPTLFWDSRKTRVLSLIGTFFGFISGLSFIGVAFTPADLYVTPHILFVQLAFTTFFLGVFFYALAILLNSSFPNLYAVVNIIFGGLLGSISGYYSLDRVQTHQMVL